MARYRKKPVEIEAVCWDGDEFEGSRPAWLPPLTIAAGLPPVGAVWRSASVLFIGTLEGTMRADPGDWIIRGVMGELYPCKPEIFAATYEPA